MPEHVREGATGAATTKDIIGKVIGGKGRKENKWISQKLRVDERQEHVRNGTKEHGTVRKVSKLR